MSEGDYNRFLSTFNYDHVVWETSEDKPLGSSHSGLSGYAGEGEESVFL